MNKQKKLILIIILCISITDLFLYNNNKTYVYTSLQEENSLDKDLVKNNLEEIYKKRCESFTSLDLKSLEDYFDTSHKYGEWSLAHEIKRIKYLNDWSYNRGIKFTNVASSLKFKKISPTKKGVRVSLDEVYKFDYEYKSDETPTKNSFGVSIQHTVDLVKKDDGWIIFTDWYTDCFEDALKSYSADTDNLDKQTSPPKYNINSCSKNYEPNYEGKYNRIKAIEYADKYCGIPWASGNDLKHNKKYKNFTGAGGDCTNYVSQVLGDKEAGGLPFDGTWYCRYHKYGGGEGSKAWVNADAFRNYLIYSGKGNLIKKGSFEDLIKPNDNYSCGIIEKLELGDMICYALGSNIDHFAIVTGWDSHGYPLVNSHTTDRYRVPWDLGWGDKNIFFHLIHIK